MSAVICFRTDARKSSQSALYRLVKSFLIFAIFILLPTSYVDASQNKIIGKEKFASNVNTDLYLRATDDFYSQRFDSLFENLKNVCGAKPYAEDINISPSSMDSIIYFMDKLSGSSRKYPTVVTKDPCIRGGVTLYEKMLKLRRETSMVGYTGISLNRLEGSKDECNVFDKFFYSVNLVEDSKISFHDKNILVHSVHNFVEKCRFRVNTISGERYDPITHITEDDIVVYIFSRLLKDKNVKYSKDVETFICNTETYIKNDVRLVYFLSPMLSRRGFFCN